MRAFVDPQPQVERQRDTRMKMSGLLNWRTKRHQSGSGRRSGSAFGPVRARRSAASAVESPVIEMDRAVSNNTGS
jgi:hypothetical protein